MASPISLAARLAKNAFRIALLVGLFMAMAGIGAYVALTFIIKGEDAVMVPDLVGKDVIYGLEILSDLGLNTRVKGTVFHDQVPKHHIIDQHPEPGAAIKRGRDVKIRISRGPETIVTPNLTGLSLQQSEIILTENGLCRGALANLTHDRYAAGQIISQSPQPGTTILRKNCIDLLVSQGPSRPAFPMADLTGFSLKMAIGRLERLQLKAGSIRFVHKAGSPEETVVEQVPAAGYPVIRGSRIDLAVNRSNTDTQTDSTGITNSVELFRFSLENGFLKKRVQVKMNQARISISLFDDFLSPGQEVWILAPKSGNPTILVYVDDQLVQTRM